MGVVDEAERIQHHHHAAIVFERECRFWGATDRQIRFCDGDPNELHQLRSVLRQQLMTGTR